MLEKIGRRNLTEPYLLCSTQQCQVYAGAGKEHPRTTRAVEKTRGVVLLRDGGGLADVRYSASSGGRTEDNDAIWGGPPDPSLRGRADTADRKLAERFAVIDDRNLDAFLAIAQDHPSRGELALHVSPSTNGTKRTAATSSVSPSRKHTKRSSSPRPMGHTSALPGAAWP